MDKVPQSIVFLNAFLVIFSSAEPCTDSVFVFGDSQFDAGNNPFIKNCMTQANFPPYGSTFFNHPTGRFTNGRTITDFLAQHLGIEFQKPLEEVNQELTNGSWKDFPSNGINFASAGSGVLPHTNKLDGVTTIEAQLQQFQDLVDKNQLQKPQIEKSLFFFEAGSNDIMNYFLSPSDITEKDYVDFMLKEADRFVEKIYNLGARKIVIFSVGPMGCVPARVFLKVEPLTQCFEKVNMSQSYNAGLELLANNISSKYPGGVGVYGIIFDTVQKFRSDPKLHGYANVNKACCGRGPLN